MDCYPPCQVCTGLCQKEPHRPVPATPRRIARKHGTTDLVCGHTAPADEITMTVLGDGLGAQPYCERCGDFRAIKKRKRPARNVLPGEPMF